jgi:hypothetical protein
MNFIQGDKFESVGHFTFSPIQKSSGDYSQLPNTFDKEKCLQYDPCIVYTHTFYVKELFDVIRNIEHEFVVVTHNCDLNVDFEPPANVIRWHTQNMNIIRDNIYPLPTGLENDRWFKDVKKKEKMALKITEQRNIKNLVYMNFNIQTNKIKREPVYHLFKDRSWVTSDMGQNGQRFDDFIDNIYNHKFVLCPNGKGLDTHRFWESLYMGTIPIVKRDILASELYACFPAVIVDNWEDVTESFLAKEYIAINDIKMGFDGWKRMLDLDYWKESIRREWI